MDKKQEKRALIAMTYLFPLSYILVIILVSTQSDVTHTLWPYLIQFSVLAGLTLALSHLFFMKFTREALTFNQTIVRLAMIQSLILTGVIIYFIPFLF